MVQIVVEEVELFSFLVPLFLWDQFVIRLVEFASEIGTPRHAKLSFVVAVVACWVKYCWLAIHSTDVTTPEVSVQNARPHVHAHKELVQQLIEKLDQFFVGVDVRPSILHGDLWSGNICAVDGEPTIFDPACYYGHHEAEFGMSWCANFGSEFYQAYHELIPKEQGYEERKQLYLLYHYLNHYNLFGGGYYRTAVSLLRGLVAL
eukprot:CAMPEP_0114292756 /NCGR_PEP_ID=MMETSP0059-20121206/9237_1 /TAXON_ID=36894 /ORGANISM="Pyramimonas parkeae, Strain CCMP726" /LENGTH=203 /DNA_ID=CAMNT_0001414437 /DNA_START=334 /DNA_END=945 /DNA_ORIENTATION=-